jgi:hypothetical protein
MNILKLSSRYFYDFDDADGWKFIDVDRSETANGLTRWVVRCRGSKEVIGRIEMFIASGLIRFVARDLWEYMCSDGICCEGRRREVGKLIDIVYLRSAVRRNCGPRPS